MDEPSIYTPSSSTFSRLEMGTDSFHSAQYVGELDLDELNLLFFDCADNIFLRLALIRGHISVIIRTN